MKHVEQFLWTEKYRPQKVSETILPSATKAIFQQFVDDKNVPNLLLFGGPGIGKTTVARAMLEELGCDILEINGSLHGNLDTLRTDILAFASTVSFTGGRKYVLLDEADYLTPHTQPALRNFMESFASNCGFILTCNFKNKIIEALQSRTSCIEFRLTAAEKVVMAAQMLGRLETILKAESIPFDKKVLVELVKKYLPDWRRCINELQRYAATGKIDTGILATINNTDIKDLLGAMKEKNFGAMRTWIAQNQTEDTATLFRRFYDMAVDVLDPKSVPMLIVTLADYQYKAAFVVDQEINLAACLTEVMHSCTFK